MMLAISTQISTFKFVSLSCSHQTALYRSRPTHLQHSLCYRG